MRKTILTLGLVLFAQILTVQGATTNFEPEVYKEYEAVKAFEVNQFCLAIVKGDMELVKKMIQQGEDVNRRSMGKTPAHYAARYNKPEIMKILVKHGANLKKRCSQGFTVKKYAELSQSKEVLKIIDAAMKR